MNELKIIENKLLPIYQNDQNENLVNARELHEFLGSNSKFADWIKNRIEKYDFNENADYVTVSKNLENGGRTIDYILTLDTAKEIAMVENNDKGRQVRKYFIELEKRYKLDTSQLSPELQMFQKIFQSVAQQQLKVNQLETKLDVMQSNLLQEHKDDWRGYINKVLKGIGYKTGNYNFVRNESYNELEKRASCKLDVRLGNLKSRALNQGMALSKVNNLNKLDILEDESRLREIYLSIIREYAIKYEIEVTNS